MSQNKLSLKCGGEKWDYHQTFPLKKSTVEYNRRTSADIL